MRIFDLFLRRAGVDRAHALNGRPPVSRLTFECPRDVLGTVRKQVYTDFHAAGLAVSALQVDARADQELASACITVHCPPDRRSALMAQARRLGSHPGVRGVRFGRTRRAPNA